MRKLLISTFSIFLVAVLLFQTSCKKDEVTNTGGTTDCPTATYPVTGLWTGTYSVDNNSTPARFYSFSIYPDGTVLTKGLLADSEFSYSSGTWTLNGNAFSATITNFLSPSITQKVTATFSNTGTLTNATWQDTVNPYGLLTGTFSNVVRN